jgi:hypothetical protein
MLVHYLQGGQTHKTHWVTSELGAEKDASGREIRRLAVKKEKDLGHISVYGIPGRGRNICRTPRLSYQSPPD